MFVRLFVVLGPPRGKGIIKVDAQIELLLLLLRERESM